MGRSWAVANGSWAVRPLLYFIYRGSNVDRQKYLPPQPLSLPRLFPSRSSSPCRRHRRCFSSLSAACLPRLQHLLLSLPPHPTSTARPRDVDEEATDREAGKRNQAVLLPWPGLDQPHLPPPSPAERSGGSASSSEQGRTGIRSRDLLARGRHRTDSNLQPVPTQKVTVIQEEPDATEDANVQVSIANCHKHREPLEYLHSLCRTVQEKHLVEEPASRVRVACTCGLLHRHQPICSIVGMDIWIEWYPPERYTSQQPRTSIKMYIPTPFIILNASRSTSVSLPVLDATRMPGKRYEILNLGRNIQPVMCRSLTNKQESDVGKKQLVPTQKHHDSPYKSMKCSNSNSGDLSTGPSSGSPSAMPGCSSCQCGTGAAATTAAK
ncbi:uncharacterized protein LOC125523623 isoform X3 [Triticum urartu]|uniref:uncharacterized protein LOC125523623 isoform X3 n=1 Tax=Triticum urartu TaxID=4572 RepID=UPI002043BE72|nr:uncharacterized protein LOC125523623 isoform X3 [Triticum urartu]